MIGHKYMSITILGVIYKLLMKKLYVYCYLHQNRFPKKNYVSIEKITPKLFF